MKHYDEKRWQLYIKELLPVEEMLEMEDHLTECDTCLDIFLNLMDDEKNKTSDIIPDDFTQKTIDKIKYYEHHHTASSQKNLLIYYAAAAIITLCMMSSGLFDTLTHTLPNLTQAAISENHMKDSNFIYDFSNRIVQKTSRLIDRFE